MLTAFNNPVRRKILSWLNDRSSFPASLPEHAELDGVCVDYIQEKAELSLSTISNYMGLLKDAGLVESERHGKWAFYRRNEKSILAVWKRLKKTFTGALQLTDQPMENEPSNPQNMLANSLELPCGVILKNRIAKSPMSDALGDGEGNPTGEQIRLYERWAEGGVALSFIGEVQAIPEFPEKPGNLVLGTHSNKNMLKQLTARSTIDGAHLWPQLGHAGALAHSPISQPKGPSELDIDGLQCPGMTTEDIQQLPAIYARAAALAKSVGFSGVHIHAGHGFLLSQFLSPLFNHRNDSYGGSIEARSRIVLEIIRAVRGAVGPSFPIGIRINSTDQLEGGLSSDDALELVRMLDKSSIDLIDISGGTYFPGAKASSEGNRGGLYFIDFARQAREVTRVPLILTGGIKRRAQAVDAIASGTIDMVNLGRAMVLNPQLPESWMSDAEGDPDFPKFDAVIPGGITAWYTMRIIALGEERENSFKLDLPSAIQAYNARTEKLCFIWKKKFAQK